MPPFAIFFIIFPRTPSVVRTHVHNPGYAPGSYTAYCLASPANFIYGRVLAKALSHVTIMPVLLRPVNNFLGQVIGNASEGKYNTRTMNNSSSGEVTFQKCLK